MSPRRIGILFGMEREFPPALAERINALADGRAVAEPVQVGVVRDRDLPAYDLILDRISHEVPFYRSWLKAAAARGTRVVNNPFWWSADDKFLGNVIALEAGVSVPKTALVPHKEHPPNTRAESFTNLRYPLDWDTLFDDVGFPLFLKPAHGGGWRDVHRVESPEAFFRAYDTTKSLLMIAQEAIDFTEYYRCYVLGRERVRVMAYDPRQPFERRYVRNGEAVPPGRLARLERDALTLCKALGYDFNTIEFAVREGTPYAIDFMNPAPDCDRFSVGVENFEWVVSNGAEVLLDRVRKPAKLEVAGGWIKRAGRRIGAAAGAVGAGVRKRRPAKRRRGAAPADPGAKPRPRPAKRATARKPTPEAVGAGAPDPVAVVGRAPAPAPAAASRSRDADADARDRDAGGSS
jgi:glutathione synthase/RimK-type ligase-like ATP-grasp enzyme